MNPIPLPNRFSSLGGYKRDVDGRNGYPKYMNYPKRKYREPVRTPKWPQQPDRSRLFFRLEQEPNGP